MSIGFFTTIEYKSSSASKYASVSVMKVLTGIASFAFTLALPAKQVETPTNINAVTKRTVSFFMSSPFRSCLQYYLL
jgi:hypothetical protein